MNVIFDPVYKSALKAPTTIINEQNLSTQLDLNQFTKVLYQIIKTSTDKLFNDLSDLNKSIEIYVLHPELHRYLKEKDYTWLNKKSATGLAGFVNSTIHDKHLKFIGSKLEHIENYTGVTYMIVPCFFQTGAVSLVILEPRMTLSLLFIIDYDLSPKDKSVRVKGFSHSVVAKLLSYISRIITFNYSAYRSSEIRSYAISLNDNYNPLKKSPGNSNLRLIGVLHTLDVFLSCMFDYTIIGNEDKVDCLDMFQMMWEIKECESNKFIQDLLSRYAVYESNSPESYNSPLVKVDEDTESKWDLIKEKLEPKQKQLLENMSHNLLDFFDEGDVDEGLSSTDHKRSAADSNIDPAISSSGNKKSRITQFQ